MTIREYRLPSVIIEDEEKKSMPRYLVGVSLDFFLFYDRGGFPFPHFSVAVSPTHVRYDPTYKDPFSVVCSRQLSLERVSLRDLFVHYVSAKTQILIFSENIRYFGCDTVDEIFFALDVSVAYALSNVSNFGMFIQWLDPSYL